MKKRIFVSSVQKEFAAERKAIRNLIQSNPLLNRLFSVFLFEGIPARDRRADQIYLEEVDKCDVYVGLFGREYGSEDARGMSPTEREFDRAVERSKTRLIFLKDMPESDRDLRMKALIARSGAELVRAKFKSTSGLLKELQASLAQYLEDSELLRTRPFDSTPCPDATLADLDPERMNAFIERARRARAFPLAQDSSPEVLLTHLHLMDRGRPTYAAVLLFGRQPQRFLISSQVKCAHFHGTTVAKPIPSYQVYKGTVFELVEQAVDFVMSKINLAVGTRAEGVEVPVAYEIPIEAVTEAVVNAVAHRDYASRGSVQVMLFADRLEVWNPGALPSSLTLQMLREPHSSFPGNPLLAEPLYTRRHK